MKNILFNDNKLSKLSLGTVQFGLNYGISNKSGQVTQNEVNNIIKYVCDNGINCFDTAQAYGNSEEVLGKSINEEYDLFIVSKLKSEIFIDDATSSVEKSLNHLNVNTLYGLLLHDSKLLYDWKDEYTLFVNNLIQENKIKYFGVSIYTNEDFELAIQNPLIKIIQIPFNIFDQRAISENWFKKAKDNNKLIFIRSIFLQGLFFMDIDNLPEKLCIAKKYLVKYNEYCHKFNISKSQLALNFVDTVAKDSILLFGCDNVEQAKENIQNYNNLELMEDRVIEDIINDFKNIDEKIYNPTKW